MNFIIKRRILIAMLFTALSLLGYYSYKQLAVELSPNAQLPELSISISSQLEVDPRYMESQVIIPLESAAGSLKGVEEINSTAGPRQGHIQISYRNSVNQKYAYLKLVEKIDEVKSKLPKGFNVEVIKANNSANNTFMSLQVRGSGGVDRVRQVTDKEITDKLLNIDGIVSVEVFGGRKKSIEIVLKEDVCKSYGITAGDVRNTLNQNNKSRVFAGKLSNNNRIQFVNIVAEFTDINEIYELEVKKQGSIKLKDIATINYGVKKEDSYSRVNGKESVTLQLVSDAQSNIIELSNDVKEKIKKLNIELDDKDIQMVIQNNTAEIMEDNIDLIINLAITGGILAIFILWIFLKNIRLVAAIALAIPISVFTAFNFFYAFDISLNSLTLLGMALAIGMLLDNSVVVLENIYRLASKGLKPEQAVIQGTKEVWRSIVAATLTTITVFLPFVFSPDYMISLLGKHIGISIISTLLVSLLVALLLIPMITYVFLKLQKKHDKIYFENVDLRNRLIQIYMVFLKTCMRYPAQTILGALALFFITLLISLSLSSTIPQEAEIKDLSLYMTMPKGSTLEKTDLVIRCIEKKLENFEEKEDLISQVYEEEAILNIKLKENYYEIRNLSIPQIKNHLLNELDEFSQADFSWYPPSSGGRLGGSGFSSAGGGTEGFAKMFGIGSAQEKILIKGQNYDKILNLADNIKYYLDQLSSMNRVKIQTSQKQPELKLLFDKQLMSTYNIAASSVTSGLNSLQTELVSGVYFKHNDDEYEIIIKTLSDKNNEKLTRDRNLYDLKNMEIKASNSESTFNLENISDLNFTRGLASIKRTNQEKQLEITYSFISEVTDDKDLLEESRQEVDEIIGDINIQSGLAVEVIHEENNLGEFKFLMIIAFILIFMILASVFESLTIPVVMMFSIPMAAIGSILALILTGNSLLNANSLTGLLILLGIVVNNGIILIDYTKILQRRGYNEYRALMMAGMARVRPIFITAITTIIALIPLALGKAEYVSQIGVPFAITVIGGLILSTLLTLVFIPTLNSGMESAIKWIQKQKIQWRLIHWICWIGGTVYIYYEVNNEIWKIIAFLLLIILIPAIHFFIQSSLRQAKTKLIDDDEPLHIRIRNLVKIYDRDNQFAREWKSGLQLRERIGVRQNYESFKDFSPLLWQIPLIGFFIYLIYFHVTSALWYFLLPVGLYMIIRLILAPIKRYADTQKEQNKNKFIRVIVNIIYKFCFWFLPLVVCSLSYLDYGLLANSIVFGSFWYLAIFIKYTSDKIYKNKVNVNRLKGRFKGLRKGFYRFVLIIPIIGKKKQAFKAVKQINIDIKNGMFGLLGPNGAGKSTLMKIICGILDQSYGQITINGIDVQQKREELQGLIGYLPQEFGMYENMTAWDFLNYISLLKKLFDKKEREQRVEYVLKAVRMFDDKDEKIESFSGGMKQRIGIAQILLNLPRILVVDEPTAGLDPRERIRFRNLLVELSRNRIVIFSTHIIEDVASSCQNVAVMKKGEVKYIGKPIDMAKIAKGKVWTLNISVEEFEKFKDDYIIIHHMREGNNIRVRCLSKEKPLESASQLKGNLEDAYLCLLTDNN
jgi:multidrug efflux pump subunit AcrB/ABC-type multidrug transport system ATPase subunit